METVIKRGLWTYKLENYFWYAYFGETKVGHLGFSELEEAIKHHEGITVEHMFKPILEHKGDIEVKVRTKETPKITKEWLDKYYKEGGDIGNS